ncbi:hypothetical protein L0Z13_08735 [Burkholderia multivorans]|uniref:hypothetical protein n=1 Tax=Burkholderia multivorans TaxID=87883 RepID=UPI00055FAF79|nr:hypothetical protein [Burkholderia multivorans]AVR22494.1 hypothetical protein A8H40_24570 [Burkholderia multivorans]MBU9494160.1 hypothetical protein [Burkholderia multivorans]MCO1435932.1 hypothetical protein [Burkholderia multivorans]UQN61715.1 hypothetical protein L0Y94_18935 [Burkholderia multivorans]UQN64974.1 hypothetical protein L0Y92_22420 [Burkholderia multivorans]
MKTKDFWTKACPISLLTLVAVYGTFAGTNEQIVGWLHGTWAEPYLYALHSGNSIIFNLSVGFVNSVVFWIMVVVYPERKRNKVMRKNLHRRYTEFRESTVQTLLHAAGISCSSKEVQDLTDYRKFREFFDTDCKARWYDALNGLQTQRERMDDLLLEMEMLADEVRYVLNKINIDDDHVHASFKLLCTHILRLRRSGIYTHDQVKYVGQFIWGTLAQWSFVDGQLDVDPVQKLIDSI